MGDKHAAAYHGSDLQRRRELAGMSKTELVDWVIQLETSSKRTEQAINALKQRIADAYGDEP